MGQCETCNREAEYNAIDSDDLMHKLQQTDIGRDISKLRADNRQQLQNYSFTPMADKSFYKGKISNTKREGYGQNYAGCFNYYGFYKNDLPHGEGAIITEDQCVIGTFQMGILEGKGKEWAQGISFEGYYRRGERVEGRLTTDSLSYNGYFEKGVFHGKGHLKKGNLSYEGDFKNGKFNGHGKAVFEGGSIYQGGFKEGLYHGYGQFKWHNGNFYRGEYFEGQRHGFGVLKIGIIEYEGNWNKGLRQGHGILKQEEQFAFGNWKSNMLVQE